MEIKNSFGFLGGLVRILALSKSQLLTTYRSGSGHAIGPGNAKTRTEREYLRNWANYRAVGRSRQTKQGTGCREQGTEINL
jgi:hypothetical protein